MRDAVQRHCCSASKLRPTVTCCCVVRQVGVWGARGGGGGGARAGAWGGEVYMGRRARLTCDLVAVELEVRLP